MPKAPPGATTTITAHSPRVQSRDSGLLVALNTVSAWLALAAGTVVGFLLTPFLLDHLGERVYGLYSLGASVAAWSTFVAVPLGTYACRYATEHLEQGKIDSLKRTMANSLALSLVAAALLMVPVAICAAYARRLFNVPSDLVATVRTVILIVGLIGVATIVIRVLEGTVFMSRRFYLRHAADVTSRVVGALLVVAYFTWIGPSVGVWLLMGDGLPLLLSVTVVIPLARRGLPLRLTSLDLDGGEVQRALPFVGLMAVTAVGTLLFDNTSALVISRLPELGLSQVAAYEIGARWLRLIRPLIEAFVVALSPALVALVARGDRQRLAREVTSRMRQALLLGMVPATAIACVAVPLVTYWVGAQFVPRSVPVMWMMLASAILWTPGIYTSRLMVATARLRLATVGSVAAGILNLALSICFVRWGGLGLVGVAAGTLVAVALWSNLFMPWLACRTCGIKATRYLKEVWLRPLLTLPVMLVTGYGFTAAWAPHSLVQTFWLLVALGIVFTGLALALGVNAEERQLLGEQLRSVLARWKR